MCLAGPKCNGIKMRFKLLFARVTKNFPLLTISNNTVSVMSLSTIDLLLNNSTGRNLFNTVCMFMFVCVKVSQKVGEVRCGCFSHSSIAFATVYLSGSSLPIHPTRICLSNSPHSSTPSWWTWVLCITYDL